MNVKLDLNHVAAEKKIFNQFEHLICLQSAVKEHSLWQERIS